LGSWLTSLLAGPASRGKYCEANYGIGVPIIPSRHQGHHSVQTLPASARKSLAVAALAPSLRAIAQLDETGVGRAGCRAKHAMIWPAAL